jgi:HTH-type transcriptional regulator / antitoxin HigA
MTLQALEKKLKPLQEPLRNDALKWFYLHFPPRPITNKKMHRTYSEVASVLMRELEMGTLESSAKETVKAFLNALVPFIEAYEKSHMAIPAASPEEMFRFLIEQHALTQYDLSKELGGQPVVSDVVHGKRKLTRDHIEKLGKRFHISPAAFYPAFR